MDAQAIKQVLVDLGARQSDLKVINGWVSTKCILAPWTHQSGADSAPSAGVSIKDTPIFNCYTCGHTMPLHAIVRKLAGFTGDDYDDLIEELEENAYLGPKSVPTWDELKTADTAEILMPLNEGLYMDLYDIAVGHPYLRARGISDATARKLELLFDPEDPVDKSSGRITVPRILFPVRGPDGSLYGFSGRDTSGKSPVKVRDYHGLKKAHCVLGAHLVTSDNPKYVITVEGLFDYANAHECGEPGCAVMHSSMTDAQAEIFRGFGKPTYLFYDDDEAGDKGVNMAARQLFDYLPVMRVRYPKVEIEDNSKQGYHLLKDPGEMLAEDFTSMIEDSRPISVKPRPWLAEKPR